MDPLGALIEWAAPLGLVGLLAIGAMERVVPVLPSYGLLVAIGIGAADGLWSAPLAIVAVTTGSTAACLALYGIVMASDEARAQRFVLRTARLIGLSPDRLARWVEVCRERQLPIVFASQLVPTVRLITPAIAGVLRADLGTFVVASAGGIATWNSLFVGIGFVAATVTPDVNVSALALQILVGLITLEAAAVVAWRRRRRRLAGPTPIHALQDETP